MRGISFHKDKKSSRTAAPASRNGWSFEWPLLIYPVLFLATLALLYVVNRAIENEPPATIRQPGPATSLPANNGIPAISAPLHPAPTLPGAVGAQVDRPSTSQNGPGPDASDRPSLVAGQMPPAGALDRLYGVDKTLAMLRRAIEKRDQTGIKECVAELAAMGEEAIIPLQDLLTNEQGETALWAATALARIGTPLATHTLLERLSQVQEGPFKEDLGKRVSSIGNHESWPILLDTMMQTSDATVLRAAGASLSTVADTAVLDEIIARYETATTEREIERLAQLVRNIRSPQATESLLSLAGSVSSAPQGGGLQEAAIDALAKVGDAQSVSHLLRRLEASPPGEETRLFNAITQIDSPEAHSSLLYAAAGNKEVSAEHGRTAAIYALKNFPNIPTVALLERILVEEQNVKVLTAAARTLEDIRRGPHAVTAKAEALQKSAERLPLPPVEK